MPSFVPIGLGNVTAPPAAESRDPGGGILYAWNGTPYWLDSRGNTYNLTQGLGGVAAVNAGDASMSATGTVAVTVESGTLDQVANLHPAGADWSNNGHKITSVGNGTAAQDAASYGQTPAGGNTVTVGQGGTGATTAANAITALTGPQTGNSGKYLRSNGTAAALSSLAAADMTGTLAVANGGTGSSSQNFVDLTTGQSIGGTKTFTGELVVPAPVNTGDAATKAYVDGVAQGLNVKNSVVAATTTGLPAYTYNNGTAGFGATLTGNSTGTLTVDTHTVALNDRILVKNETGSPGAAYNGIYLCTTAGAGGGSPAAYVLTRATDMDAGTEVPGAFTFVQSGSVNALSGFVVVSTGTYTIGTTAITFTQFSASGAVTAGTGLTLIGSTLSLSNPVPIGLGGTGQSSAANAITALTGTQTSGFVLRSTGSAAALAPLQPGDGAHPQPGHDRERGNRHSRVGAQDGHDHRFRVLGDGTVIRADPDRYQRQRRHLAGAPRLLGGRPDRRRRTARGGPRRPRHSAATADLSGAEAGRSGGAARCGPPPACQRHGRSA